MLINSEVWNEASRERVNGKLQLELDALLCLRALFSSGLGDSFTRCFEVHFITIHGTSAKKCLSVHTDIHLLHNMQA